MKNIVIIASGGADSSTLLWQLSKDKDIDCIDVLSFNYGQRHKKELEYLKLFIGKVKDNSATIINHKIVDISSIKELIDIGSLTGNAPVPEGHYAAENMKSTVIPNRNMIMLSLAAGYAIKIGAHEVYYAAHHGDHFVYEDCRKEFVKALDSAVYLGNLSTPVEIKAPFIEMSKTDVIELGLKLGVPYQYTWSCYKANERPCTKDFCGTCFERVESFFINHTQDPLMTVEEWNDAVEFCKHQKVL